MNKIILRPALPAHMSIIKQFHREQNERDAFYEREFRRVAVYPLISIWAIGNIVMWWLV